LSTGKPVILQLCHRPLLRHILQKTIQGITHYPGHWRLCRISSNTDFSMQFGIEESQAKWWDFVSEVQKASELAQTRVMIGDF
jgi:hypothetical protein